MLRFDVETIYKATRGPTPPFLSPLRFDVETININANNIIMCMVSLGLILYFFSH